jgi:hypothetical protein
MKNLLPAFLLFTVLFVSGSCNMEKRLYRNGWYTERTHHVPSSQEQATGNTIAPTDITSKDSIPVQDSIAAASPVKRDTIFSPLEKKLKELRQKQKALQDDPIVKMTYAEARASMAKKGCQPNKAATTVYFLSLASLITLLFGIGFFLIIGTLIYSIFAINKVVADGNCVEENIAIIKAGQRICWGILIAMAIIALSVAALFLAIIYAWGGW